MSDTITAGHLLAELTILSGRVEALEQKLEQNGATLSRIDLAGVMAEVHAITQQLFPGKCEFTSEFDPEYPDDRYVVVNVEAIGEPKEIVDRSALWHEQIRKLSGDLPGNLRLSIVPV